MLINLYIHDGKEILNVNKNDNRIKLFIVQILQVKQAIA
jgi:hypothetical protein